MIYFKKRSLWKRLFLKLSEARLPRLSGFFGFFKSILVFCVLCVLTIYILYLFLLPKYITDERVEVFLNNYLKAHSGLTLDIKNFKVKPDYKFDIRLNADEISIKYPNKINFVKLDNADIEINLITLLFNYIDLNKIKSKRITINTNFTKNCHYNCFDNFDIDILDFKDSKLNLRNIRIISDEVILNLFDENINKNFHLKTKKFIFSSSDIEKPVLIQTQGEISSVNKIADFKLNLEIKLQEKFIKNIKSNIMKLNYNPLNEAYRFKFYTYSDINLKVKNNNIAGYINLSDLNFLIDNIQIPKNNILLTFKGQKIKAQGDFNLIKNQFIKLNMNADYSKNKFLELKLASSEINLADFKRILGALCKIFNFKYNFDNVKISGEASADVYLKSNYKTIASHGFINIKNAILKDENSGLILNDINSNINFDNNKINIQKTSALIGESKFHLDGNIDNQTNLNLKVNSDSINVAQILNTIKNLPLLSRIVPELNDYIFQSGFVRVKADIKGTINNPVIETNSSVTNLKLFIKSLNCLIQSSDVAIIANPENNIIKKIFISAKNNVIYIENNKIFNALAKLELSQNDITLQKTSISFEKIKADVEGVIKNYNKNSLLELNISALLPLDNSLIIIKNKIPRIVANVQMDKNKISVKNAEIIDSQNKNQKLAHISGEILDYSKKNIKFENLKISLLDRISCILPKMDNLNFEAFGDITISGSINNPIITGAVKLYNVICKKYDLFIQDCDLNIRNSNVEGSIVSLDIFETTLYDVVFKGNFDGNILKIANFSADIFQGKISGNADIDVKTFKTNTEFILKEISIRHLSSYLKEYSIAVSGRLSALSRLTFTGLDCLSAINSLEGYIKFNIDNGELSQFAKLERFLQAGNILSQSILKLTLNSIVSSITKQNTGDFKTIEGTVKIKSPMAEIQYINTQGTNMSLHIEGRYNILNNHAILRVLGRIPLNIVSIMGNIGEFSLSRLFDKQPSKSAIEKMMSDYMSEDERKKIPPLAGYKQDNQTREFTVIIDGLLNNNSSVKYFKWGYKN